jgi:hypothetical protein
MKPPYRRRLTVAGDGDRDGGNEWMRSSRSLANQAF